MPLRGDARAELTDSELAFPRLHGAGAQTVARDRWERLVTSIDIDHPPESVWEALCDPERIRHWLALCRGSLLETGKDTVLDFEDGEFFLVRPVEVRAPRMLRYLTRWQGIGQASSVTWELEAQGAGTRVTVTEEALNPPWDWQTWNGGGWPGILEQLAAHLRTGATWRWPWRRMGPYAQIELPASIFGAWDRLFSEQGLKYWLLATTGRLQPGAEIPIVMGDASGSLEMRVDRVVQPGEEPPSFLPFVTYRLARKAWATEVPGRLWIEPAGWGRCLLQVFNANWESLPAELQLSERRLLAGYWTDAMRRAGQAFAAPGGAPHNW